MNLSYPAGATPAAEALCRAVGVSPRVQGRVTPRGTLDAFYWRTPWLSNYELEQSDEVILALHTGGSRTVRTLTQKGWSDWMSAPGQLHVIPAKHRASFKPDGRLEFVTLHFGQDRLDNLIRCEKGLPISPSFRFAFDDAFARSCVRTLCEELRQPREFGSLFVDSLADALFLHLLRLPADRHERTAVLPRRISRACEKIEASIAHGVSLEALATEAGMSRFHFARAFREAVGEPPHRYLTRCRIERAKTLLRNQELPLAEIALIVGYSSQSHFTTAFRSLLNCTPRQFRASRGD